MTFLLPRVEKRFVWECKEHDRTNLSFQFMPFWSSNLCPCVRLFFLEWRGFKYSDKLTVADNSDMFGFCGCCRGEFNVVLFSKEQRWRFKEMLSFSCLYLFPFPFVSILLTLASPGQ